MTRIAKLNKVTRKWLQITHTLAELERLEYEQREQKLDDIMVGLWLDRLYKSTKKGTKL